MKRILSILFAIFIGGTFLIQAQKSTEFSFNQTVHDFGRIKEDGGKVLHKFVFKNTGKTPIIIKNVESSCGCTAPEWTRTPIVPGKDGFVSAEYDPQGRPGVFSKQITVFNNITAQPIVLEIKGDVIPKTKGIEDLYRYKVGDIRMKSSHVAFAQIPNTKKVTQTVEIINDSDNPVSVAFKENNFINYLTLSVSPETLKPKQTGVITVTYDATKSTSWGFRNDRIALILNGQPATGYPLTVSASVVEDFSVLTRAELENAPTMDFEEKEFNFGSIKQGEKITHEFKFKNNGKRDLIIRDTQTTCGCTAVDTKKVIKPGETSTIKAVFNSSGKKGNQNKSITLITNIPGTDQSGIDKYKVILRLKGVVATE